MLQLLIACEDVVARLIAAVDAVFGPPVSRVRYAVNMYARDGDALKLLDSLEAFWRDAIQSCWTACKDTRILNRVDAPTL